MICSGQTLAPSVRSLPRYSLRRDDLNRFHLVSDVIDRVPSLGAMAAYAKQSIRDQFIEHSLYITEHSEDMPKICDRTWSDKTEWYMPD